MPIEPEAARPSHSALPTDPSQVDALPQAYHDLVERGLTALGLTLDPAVRAGIDAHARLLLAWSGAINLTALRTPEAVATGHVLDSLSAMPVLRALLAADRGVPTSRPVAQRPTLLDLGSGGGYPGLPLALALPAGRAALVDSIGKKARFLAVAAEAARAAVKTAGGEPPDLASLRERAEDLAREQEHREGWDLVVVRAVGSLAEVGELGLPLVRLGGHLVAWKRNDGTGRLAGELADAKPLVRAAGGGRIAIERVASGKLAALATHRLVVIRKARESPFRYPRTAAERRLGC